MPRLREWRAAHIEKQNHMCQKTADSEMLFFEYCLKGQQGLA